MNKVKEKYNELICPEKIKEKNGSIKREKQFFSFITSAIVMFLVVSDE
jgi:hypothetical protein